MGLLNRLQTQGSTLSNLNGTTATINPLTTNQSPLHALVGEAGYSVNGAFTSEVTNYWNQYDDGVSNALPLPSTLDLNAVIPPFQTSPIQNGQTGLQPLPYLLNLPG